MKILFIGSECELLSIEYLSAALKLKGHDVFLSIDPRLFDTELVSNGILSHLFNYKKTIVKDIGKINPDLICFSVCSDNFQWALDLSLLIKQNRGIPIIFGGIHPTISPDEVIKYPSIDYVCVGEGDDAIVDLAHALEDGKDTTSIPNIWAKRSAEVFANRPRPLIQDLDGLPFPDKEIYNKNYPRFMQGYKIIASRGCPYICSYCASHQLSEIYKDKEHLYRRRSVRNIIEELVIAKERYNIKMVRFFDDIFTFDRDWLREFSRIYKREINLPYFCFSHPQNCDKEIINLLEDSGCATVFMGFGTYSEEKREEVLKRHYTNQKIRELIYDFRKSGIYLIIDFILGLPGQTKDEVTQMAHFFNNHRPDALSGLFLRYYPKTSITNFASNAGLLNDKQLSLINKARFSERIIIEKQNYDWLKKIQALMLLSKYLPRPLVDWCIRIKFYAVLPSLDLNNLSVIFDSIIPKINRKRRVHTDTISPFQYAHFYIYYANQKLKNDIDSLFLSLKDLFIYKPKKAALIYKLGFSRTNIKKILLSLRYALKTKLLGKNCPGAVIIGLTNNCQCKCVHCSVGFYPSTPEQEMDTKKIKKILDDIVCFGVPKINFFGGEPLLFGSKLIELVQYGFKKGLSISIDTNGIKLTHDLIIALKKAGINNINISLDSSDSRIHDGLRGFTGAFDSALNAIKLCVKERIPCVISTYASKRSIYSGDLKEIIKLGKGLRVTAIKILFPLMTGRWKDSNEEMLNLEEKRLVYDLLEPGFIYLESPLFSIKNNKKVCEALDKKMLYISPLGDVQPCYAVPFSFGNIRNESLNAIVTKMWGSDFLNSIENKYDCVMNNPLFREKISKVMSETDTLPIDCGKHAKG